MRADLRKLMIEISPLRVYEDEIEPEVQKTTTARVWMGWLPFDVGICKFELDQWLGAYDLTLNGALAKAELWKVSDEVARLQDMIRAMKSEEN